MGMKQLPNKSGEFLFEIIMRRYELKGKKGQTPLIPRDHHAAL
jgi:hypothetical protein